MFTIATSAYDTTYGTVSTHTSTGTDHLLLMAFLCKCVSPISNAFRNSPKPANRQYHLILHCVKTRLVLCQPITMQDYNAISTVQIKEWYSE